MRDTAPISGSSFTRLWDEVLAVSDVISTSSLSGLAKLACCYFTWEFPVCDAVISFLLLVTAKLDAPFPLIIFENPEVWEAIFIILEGVTRREEQHIMQKTTARKR
jgi:hypothetical protein